MKWWIWAGVLLLAVAAGILLVRELGHLVGSPSEIEPVLLSERSHPMRTVLLYFPSEERIGYRTEERVIQATGDREDRIESIIDALFRGPNEGYQPWSSRVTLRSVFVTEGDWVAYLDFGGELLVDWPLGDGLEWLAVGSIVRSLTENLPELRAVQLLANGSSIEDPPGSIPLDLPLMPEWFRSPNERGMP